MREQFVRPQLYPMRWRSIRPWHDYGWFRLQDQRDRIHAVWKQFVSPFVCPIIFWCILFGSDERRFQLVSPQLRSIVKWRKLLGNWPGYWKVQHC
jgi:hypothetical protein